ncbi:LysE/ArgO family amino acid transporter [Larsenimonas rhizosphaerae]|uniref:LysE/ArgO family amino acid transporter n=1 Tax=Larsenimonas rhizosphaerae TaxID=2944682 RepID=UPI0020336446|nr:LysE family transporter [Larsenimonas rhizosphaerae]MCM2129875.1 LysE family transporter [Larsenimonas rhizosphaerae]
MLTTLLHGFLTGLGLIVAIGPQNALVLKQGLLRRHVGLAIGCCAGADILLIASGALSLGPWLSRHASWLLGMNLVAAMVLFLYGLLAWRRVFFPAALEASRSGISSRMALVMQLAGVTLLNPHVYLDTWVLLGGMTAGLPLPLQPWFSGGAMLASLVWFLALGQGARYLAPVLARPAAWRVIDAMIAVIMWWLAWRLGYEVWDDPLLT